MQSEASSRLPWGDNLFAGVRSIGTIARPGIDAYQAICTFLRGAAVPQAGDDRGTLVVRAASPR